MVDLSIIIVSFNTRDLLDKCLSSIYASRPKISFEIFVVDNASYDGSAEMVKEKYPEVKLIRNFENLGFAKANNQALKICRGCYALLLNSDTEILKNALDAMVEFMDDHPEAGMINPKLVYPNMELQPSPSKLLSFWKGAVWETIFWTTPLHRLLGVEYKYKALEKGRDYDKVYEIEWARGACLMIKRDVLNDVGLLDENFFFGYEECDYNIRASQKGWKRYYVPHAVVIHYGSLSHARYGRGIGAKIYEAMFYYWEKNYSFFHGLLLRIIVLTITFTYILLRPLKVLISKEKKGEFQKFKYDCEVLKTIVKFLPENRHDGFHNSLENDFLFKKSSHEYIVDMIDYNSKVLDVGCDRGQIAKLLMERKNCKVVGVEIDLEKCKDLNFEIVVGDIEDKDILNNIKEKFDVIIFGDTLEHLKNPDLVLKKVRNYLNPASKIIVSLPNVAYWRNRRDLLFGRFNYTDYGILDRTHLRFFTFDSAIEMFNKCGYLVSKVRYTSGNFSKKGLRKRFSSVMIILFPRVFAYQFVFELTPISSNSS